MTDPTLQPFLLDVARARGEGKSFHDLVQMAVDFLKSKPSEYAGGRRDQFLEQAIALLTEFESSKGQGRSAPMPERATAMRLLTDLLTELEAAVPKISEQSRKQKFLDVVRNAAKEAEKRRAVHRQARLARGLSEQATDGKPATRIPVYSPEQPNLDLSIETTAPLKESLASAVEIVQKRYAKGFPILSDLGSTINRIEAAKKARDAKLLAGMPIGASRFGGLPDLPVRVEWPTIRDKKMPFVAQFNLSEFPAAHDLLPPHGSLFFFVLCSNDEGMRPASATVFYHDGDTSSLKRAPFPADDEIYPDWCDERVYELLPVFPDLIEKSERDGTAGWLFGEFEFDESAGRVADARFQEGDDWINLLAVNSRGSMQWSDSGDLYFVARRSDLAKRDFSHVLAAVCSS